MAHPRGAATAGRAVVTYSRGLHALAVIRSLGRRGVEVVAADEVGVTPGALSRYAMDRFVYPSPHADPDGFIAAMDEAIARFDPGHPEVPFVLMPAHEEAAVLAKAAQRWAGRIHVPLANPESFETVQHKGKFHVFAEAHGWPVPRTWRFAQMDDLRRAAPTLPYPLYLKQPTGVAGIGVHRVEGLQDLEQRLRELPLDSASGADPMPLLQQEVPGEDYCVTALYNRGAPRVLLSYRNVLTFPRGHGPGALRETVRAPGLEAIAQRVLSDLGWHGIAQVDLRWTGKAADPPLVLEVNGRFFGGVFQAIASGVDYPWLLFRMAVDGDVDAPAQVQYDVRTEQPVLGLLATLEEVAEGGARWDELERTWDQAREQLRAGDAWEAARGLLAGLREAMDMPSRLEMARQLLLDREETVSALFDADDPLPALGFVYPLAMFVRHGRLTAGMLAGTDG
jgi:predicted ATP-grasp superfamily ATP-dependent carboligase